VTDDAGRDEAVGRATAPLLHVHGLTRGFYRDLRGAFPDAGLHRRLVALSAGRLATHPTSPLPMLRS
jgi:hypothetical protein